MVLYFWNMKWLKVKVTPGGRISLIKGLSRRHCEAQGFAYRSLRRWFSVYADEGLLFCKSGKHRIPIANDYTASNLKAPNGRRTFRIEKSGEVVFQYRYKALSERLYARIDPTYDHFDEYNEDFFLWATELWTDREIQSRAHPKINLDI